MSGDYTDRSRDVLLVSLATCLLLVVAFVTMTVVMPGEEDTYVSVTLSPASFLLIGAALNSLATIPGLVRHGLRVGATGR